MTTLTERVDSLLADFWERLAEHEIAIADAMDTDDERTRLRAAVVDAVGDWLDGDVCYQRLVQLEYLTHARLTRKGLHFGATLPRDPGEGDRRLARLEGLARYPDDAPDVRT